MEGLAQILLDGLLLAIVVGAAFAWFSTKHDGLRKAFIVGAVVSFLLFLGSLCAIIVSPGNVGVVTAFGAVQNETLPPGIHFRFPFINTVHTITTRVQPHDFKDIDGSTKENLSLKVTGTMNYHVDGSNAASLYQTVGDDFAPKIIDPAFADYIKQILPNYSADSTASNFVLAKRDEIRAQTKTALNENLARYHIVVDDIYIVDIGYPQAYEDAITAKQVAQQQVQTETQIVEQRKQQAQQAIEAAKGQAQAQIELAQGQATANNLLTKSLTPELIQYTLIQKLADKIQVMLLPAGQQFLLDPKSVLAAQ